MRSVAPLISSCASLLKTRVASKKRYSCTVVRFAKRKARKDVRGILVVVLRVACCVMRVTLRKADFRGETLELTNRAFSPVVDTPGGEVSKAAKGVHQAPLFPEQRWEKCLILVKHLESDLALLQ